MGGTIPIEIIEMIKIVENNNEKEISGKIENGEIAPVTPR